MTALGIAKDFSRFRVLDTSVMSPIVGVWPDEQFRCSSPRPWR